MRGAQVVEYEWFAGSLYPDRVLEECAELYSEHYGTWGTGADRPNAKIRLSAARLRAWLSSPDSNIALARVDGRLVGYAMAIKTKVPKYGVVSWVTQLVVHEHFRKLNIAKTLLFTTWGFSDHFSWGLLTANPYAVRALEKATRRRCTPARIKKNATKLLRIGAAHVPYVSEALELVISDAESRINTEFSLDLSELEQMTANVTDADRPWLLGPLFEGWEWFAFTFHDQQQINLTKNEIEEMLLASDQVTRQAYGRMQLSESHAWARHTEDEVSLVIEWCRLTAGDQVLDLGCGAGRHANALARKGIEVLGVDYIERFVARALGDSERDVLGNVEFTTADARSFRAGRSFDAVISLYDVIGSYADDRENLRIAETIAAHLSEDGYALISVMNLASTLAKAKNVFRLDENPDRLLELAASRTMEKTGDVFNPDYYLVDEHTGVVYRKEQFTEGRQLPAELMVRDRRYTSESFRRLLESAGLAPVWIRHVRAGAWDRDASPEAAKELLALCRPAGRK